MIDWMIVVIAAFVLYFIAVLRPTGALSANALFVYIQMVMAIGTFALLRPVNEVERIYGYIVAWSILSYLSVSSVATLHRTPTLRSNRMWIPPLKPISVYRPRVPAIALIVFSIAVIVAYFTAIGYSALLEGLSNSLNNGTQDIAGQRLNSYAGSRYLFPGYVNQFKNILLPSLTVVTITYWISNKRRHPVIIGLLGTVAVFGLLGTGQRGAFIQFIVVVAIFLYLFNGRRVPRGVLALTAAGLVLVVVSTIALGRSNVTLAPDADLFDRAWVALKEFGRRVFLVQQSSAVEGFRYIYNVPIQWGREWAQGLLGILPGQGGSDLSNRIYAVLYGSARGTAPPSIWGSIYHNFGLAGIAVLPGLLGWIFASVSRRSLAPRPRNTLQLFGIAGISTTLGFWAAGAPDTLLNSGLAAYIFVWWWGTRAQSSATTTSPSGPAMNVPIGLGTSDDQGATASR